MLFNDVYNRLPHSTHGTHVSLRWDFSVKALQGNIERLLIRNCSSVVGIFVTETSRSV